MQKFKTSLTLLLSMSLAYMTAEIALRRWYYGQIPSQISTAWVYVLLLTNTMVITYKVVYLVASRGNLNPKF